MLRLVLVVLQLVYDHPVLILQRCAHASEGFIRYEVLGLLGTTKLAAAESQA